MPSSTTTPARAELHTHLGGAVDPPILWSIAHRQGIRLPTKDYWQFEAMVTMGDHDRNRGLKEMNERFLQRAGACGSRAGWLVSAPEVVQVLCAWRAGCPPLRRASLGASEIQ